MTSWKRVLVAVLVGLTGAFLPSAIATAAQSSSSHYQVNEVFFGNGGQLNACSSTYCAKQASGELGVGKTCSSAYCAQAGFNTDRTPYIQLIVGSTNTNLGKLTPGTPATATATFSVKAYLASGYQVVTDASPPTNDTYQMKTPTTPETLSQMMTNTHEFGINLVANNSCGSGLPANFGAAPVQVPSSTFGFGAANANYATACQFKYTNGDQVAYSNSSSGETDYTISYVFIANNLTPGGRYIINDVLVATGTY